MYQNSPEENPEKYLNFQFFPQTEYILALQVRTESTSYVEYIEIPKRCELAFKSRYTGEFPNSLKLYHVRKTTSKVTYFSSSDGSWF